MTVQRQGQAITTERILAWSPVVMGVLCLVLFSCIRPGPMLHGQNDFTSFYDGARLVGTPYDRAANLKEYAPSGKRIAAVLSWAIFWSFS